MNRPAKNIVRSFKKGMQLAALSLGVYSSIVHGQDEPYVYQSIIDSQGVETRDLYPGQTYTNEVRIVMPKGELLEKIRGVGFKLSASPNVHVKGKVQENPYYGIGDFLKGPFSTNRVVFGEESLRVLEEQFGSNVDGGKRVIAKYCFGVGSSQTYFVTEFKIEHVKIWNVDGKENHLGSNSLKTVVSNQAYSKSVVVLEKREEGKEIEAYFSTRGRNVRVEMSRDLKKWETINAQIEKCPSFTWKKILGEEEKVFFRVRKNSEFFLK